MEQTLCGGVPPADASDLKTPATKMPLLEKCEIFRSLNSRYNRESFALRQNATSGVVKADPEDVDAAMQRGQQIAEQSQLLAKTMLDKEMELRKYKHILEQASKRHHAKNNSTVDAMGKVAAAESAAKNYVKKHSKK